MKASKFWLIACLLIIAGCAGSQHTALKQASSQNDTTGAGLHSKPSSFNRPVPSSIIDQIPEHFFNAVDHGTRTMSGKPGSRYWKQKTRYKIDVELIPSDTLIRGSGTITYHNNSPDTLAKLYLELDQNFHKKGVVRNNSAPITGGMKFSHIRLNGQNLRKITSRNQPAGYKVNGTIMLIRLQKPLLPHSSVSMKMKWHFKIPQRGASGRMGRSHGNLYYIGYWYPQMSVYDDVKGWFTDPFEGNTEFYHDFGSYNVNVTIPRQWIINATGRLQNPHSVLKGPIYRRLQKAHRSDSVVHVVTKNDFGDISPSSGKKKVTWHFKADSVNDFAFSATKQSMWDATRTSVGDRNGDGKTDYVNINALYRSSAPLWKNAAKFTADAIHFHSQFTGLKYPWPHMTSVEGGGIIGGGMEYPMMTLIGAYRGYAKGNLYAVIAHELSHMWIPMMVSSNERRYSWMDEGTTTFNENEARNHYYPHKKPKTGFGRYIPITHTDMEGPIMRWSNHHYNRRAYLVASYPKPASMLVTLSNLLGKKTFKKAYHAFFQRWKFKHPYPWDFFNTFEDVSGRNLNWFWRSWYYQTWKLDQAVGQVAQVKNGTRIVIEDHGRVPMPATVQITLADGSTITKHISVDIWLKGATSTTFILHSKQKIKKVVIDPDHDFPDADRSNNVWRS